jgi:hypothetical protein
MTQVEVDQPVGGGVAQVGVFLLDELAFGGEVGSVGQSRSFCP